MTFNADGTILGTGFYNGDVRLWQYPAIFENANKPAYWTAKAKGATFGVYFSPDNRSLATLGPTASNFTLALPGAQIQLSSPRRTYSAAGGRQPLQMRGLQQG